MCLSLLGLASSSSAFADNYRVKVKRIGPESASGDVIIQVKPAAGEKGFSGKARFMLAGNDPGTDRSMATLLTAVSLNADVIVDVTSTPSFYDIQVINAVSLIVP